MTGRPPMRPPGPPQARPVAPGQVPVRAPMRPPGPPQTRPVVPGQLPVRVPMRPPGVLPGARPPPPVGPPRGPAPLARPPPPRVSMAPPSGMIRLPQVGPSPIQTQAARPPQPTVAQTPTAAQPTRPIAPAVSQVSHPGGARPKEYPVPAPDLSASLGGVSIAAPRQDPDSSDPLDYYGTSGKPINVVANYLKLTVDKATGVSEYEVLFKPQVDSRDEKFKLLNRIEALGKNRVFDGVKLFLPNPLNPLSQEFEAPLSSGSMNKITLKYKRRFTFNDRDAVQLFNVLFNRIMRSLHLTNHKRNYYNPAAAHNMPAIGLSVWPGYMTSVDNFHGGVLLQCDVSHRVLRTESALDVMTVHMKRGGAGFRNEIEKAMLGTSVLTRYNNKTYRVEQVSWDKSPKDTFELASGETISFVQYYQRQYNVVIKDLKQPLLLCKTKRMNNGVAEEQMLLLVPELCLMTGMTDAMRSDFRVMKELAAITRQNPARRQLEVKKFVKTIRENPEALAHLTVWGIELDDRPVAVQGRVLPPERLLFGKNYQEEVNPKGDWGRIATSRAVLTAIDLLDWTVMFPANCENEVKKFCMVMMQNSGKMGIKIMTPTIAKLDNDRPETYTAAIRKAVKPGLQLIMTVCPQQRGDRYSAIKKLCCIEAPIANQCILLKTIKDERKLASVAQKVILQMNCKLGGELWAALIPVKTLMVIGMDVWHGKGTKSIAGVVASFNPALTRYYSETAEQPAQGHESFSYLRSAVRHAFIKYHEANNRTFPEHVIIFRDGVGDGQLMNVENTEANPLIAHIYEMVKELNDRNKKKQEKKDKTDKSDAQEVTTSSSSSGDTDSTRSEFAPSINDEPIKVPSVSFVVVQKRINTRIYKPNAGSDDFENPPPGTIVDSVVTRRNFKDFFLVPQSVNQGTVTPTHFVVIKEMGNHLKPDQIQKLAYKLTHMYFNWPGTVRVPAPCQYAHKLVDLVGENIHEQVRSKALTQRLFYL